MSFRLIANIFVFILMINATTVCAGGNKEEEDRELKTHSNFASRTGPVLLIKLTNGKTVSYKDEGTCTTYENCKRWVFRGVLPGKEFFILDMNFYESGYTYLVSKKTGAQYEIYDDPHLSPDGNHVLSAGHTEMEGKNGVFLWKIQDDSLIEVFHYEPATYALYTFSKWNSSEAAEIIKFTFASKELCKNNNHMELPILFSLKNGVWQIDETAYLNKVKCQ